MLNPARRSPPRPAQAASALRCPLLCVTLLLAGCVAPTPQLDQRFGATVRLAVAQQTLDPGAAGRSTPAAGLDGTSALHGLDQYQKTFAAPPTAPAAFTIGVSGAN